jgi:transcription antitermination protein NusB
MGARHSGREAALQMLFQMEASGASADEAIELFW